jgi:predicted dehydrogenase
MPIRVIVAGLGYWGPNLLRAFAEAPDCRIVGLVDADAGRRERFGRRHPEARVFPDLDEALCEVESEAVVIATPAPTHCKLGLEALAAGRDVFVEKPITLDVAEAERLAAEADSRGRILMVGHLLLYHPAYQEAAKRLRAGEFGTLRYLCARRVNLGIVRSHENALWSLAPHDIAVANWLTGAPPLEAQAVGNSFLQEGIEDVAFYTLRYPGNVIFHGHVSWLDPQKARELSVIGTERMCVIDDTVASEKLKIFHSTVETQRQPYTSYGQFLSIRTGDILLPHIPATEPLKLEAAHFLECVRDRRRPVSDGESGVAVVKALNALSASLRSGGGWRPV